MEIQAPSRTVRPDAEAIKRLRLTKGWSVEVLADKSICSVKTLQNIEKGASVYLSTLSKIATALAVDFATLMPDGKPPSDPPLPPESRIQVQITVSIPFAQFDESKQLCGLIDSFRQFLAGGKGDIRVLNVGSGSTVITLEMTRLDVRALHSAYSEGKLAKLHCIDFRTKFEHDDYLLDPDYIPSEHLIPNPAYADLLNDQPSLAEQFLREEQKAEREEKKAERRKKKKPKPKTKSPRSRGEKR